MQSCSYGEFVLRNAIDSDKCQVDFLLESIFGDDLDSYNLSRDEYWGHYVVAEKSGEIVAVTGILPPEKSNFVGYEINWTCTKPEFRHKGLCKSLLELEIKETLPDNVPLFCEAWRIGSGLANLHGVLTSLGFRQVSENWWSSSDSQTCCFACPMKQGEHCICHTDIWRYR